MLNKESFETRLWRWAGNLFPAYRRTGAKILYVAADFHEVQITIPSNWKTRNHMGITWGGSLYSSLDPIFGVMLYKLLGRRYRVVDKTACIQFLRPAQEQLFANFKISRQELAGIKRELENINQSNRSSNIERKYSVNLVDEAGKLYASCDKVLSIGLQRKGNSTYNKTSG